MARIEGVDLPRNKPVWIALTYIYGIGHSTATDILEEVGIDPDTQVKDLTEDEVITVGEFYELAAGGQIIFT